MQDLIFWVLAGVSLLSLICAIVFAVTYRRKPKEKTWNSELLSISDLTISSEATENPRDNLDDMELTVVKSSQQPEVTPIKVFSVSQSEIPARPEGNAENAIKRPTVKPKRQSDMDVINDLLEKLK